MPIIGRLSERFSARVILTLSLIFQVLSFALLDINYSFWVIMVARVISGASSAVLPVCFALVRRNAASDTARTRGIASLMLSISIGATLGSLTSGTLTGYSLWLPILIVAAASLAGTFIIVLLLNDAKPQATHSTDNRTATLSCELAILSLVFLFSSTGFFLFRTLLPFRADSVVYSGLLVSLLSLFSGVTQLIFLFRSFKHSVYKWYAASLLFITFCFCLAGFTNQYTMMIIAIILLSVGFGTADVLGGSTLAHMTNQNNVGKASGIVFGVGAIGKVLGPSIALFFTTSQSLFYGAVLSVIFALASFLLFLVASYTTSTNEFRLKVTHTDRQDRS
jgi:MFS family permease